MSILTTMTGTVRATALVLALGATGVLAQEATPASCPAPARCVTYDGRVIAVDPTQGPYQAIVVEVRETRVTDFDGEQVTHDLLLLGLAREGEVYVIDRTYREVREGMFRTATLGDVYTLVESEQ